MDNKAPRAPPPAPQAQGRRRGAADYLPPPILIFLLSLFALYVIFSSSAPQQKEAPVIIQPEPVVDPRADFEQPHHVPHHAKPVKHKVVTSISTHVKTSIVTTTVTATASARTKNPSRSKSKSSSLSNTSLATMSSTEQTFIAIKPDGVQRGLVGPIISRFEARGYKLAAIKLVTPGKDHLEAHYADLKDKAFFPGLITYMASGPICAMVWEGRDAVKTGRTLLGATNPLASAPGTIRGDYAIDVGRNVCHGSDSVENAQKEIALWFKEGEVVSWESAAFNWVYEKA